MIEYEILGEIWGIVTTKGFFIRLNMIETADCNDIFT